MFSLRNNEMATSDKYDRQLRLWGPRGQALLSQARVVCVGSSALATETLKNIILPGVGSFLLIDDAKVDKADLGQNFFLEASDVGRLRGDAVTQHLLTLNPDVTGTYRFGNLSEVLKLDASDFDLLLICQQSLKQVAELVEKFREAKIVVVNVRGFIGTVRLFATDLEVVESRLEEGAQPDLRLHAPFPALSALADSIDLDALNDAEHSHIPWILLVLKAKRNNLEDTLIELRRMRRSHDEVNFDEAIDNAHSAFFTPRDLEICDAKKRGKFWAMKRAVSLFCKKYGNYPLPGNLLDMTSDTATFLKLQTIYQQHANAEVSLVKALLDDNVDDEYIEYYCKFASGAVGLTLSSSVGIDLTTGSVDQELRDSESLLKWYVAMNEDCLRVPSSLDLSKERAELTRYAGCELHACSAVLGGIAAQEVIKLITRIFLPLDNLFIFYGSQGVGQSLKV